MSVPEAFGSSPTSKSLSEVIARLYKREINVGLQTEEGGIHVWIGHYDHGRKIEKWFSVEDIDKTVQWIDDQSALLFQPDAPETARSDPTDRAE